MIKVFTVVFDVPDGDEELTEERVLEALSANAEWSFPDGAIWTVNEAFMPWRE
jgi:hypothetical protein